MVSVTESGSHRVVDVEHVLVASPGELVGHEVG